LLTDPFQTASNSLGERSQKFRQVELDLHRVVLDVDPPANGLPPASSREVQLVSFPSLLEFQHSAQAAGDLLLELAKAQLNAATGFIPP
jgi:hypothetical protein